MLSIAAATEIQLVKCIPHKFAFTQKQANVND